jgi:hypothetical protein
MKKTLFLMLAVLCVAVSVQAQPTTSPSSQQSTVTALEAAGPLIREFGRPGYPRITVYVWGSASSGIWRVEQGVDLLSFASAVSEMREQAFPGQRSEYYINIYRKGQTNQAPFFRSKFERLVAGRSDLPELLDGDVLVFQQRATRAFTWRDIAQVTGTLASLVSSVLLILSIGRGEVF